MNPNYVRLGQLLVLEVPPPMKAVGHRLGERMWIDPQKLLDLERRLEITEAGLLRKQKLEVKGQVGGDAAL